MQTHTRTGRSRESRLLHVCVCFRLLRAPCEFESRRQSMLLVKCAEPPSPRSPVAGRRSAAPFPLAHTLARSLLRHSNGCASLARAAALGRLEMGNGGRTGRWHTMDSASAACEPSRRPVCVPALRTLTCCRRRRIRLEIESNVDQAGLGARCARSISIALGRESIGRPAIGALPLGRRLHAKIESALCHRVRWQSRASARFYKLRSSMGRAFAFESEFKSSK